MRTTGAEWHHAIGLSLVLQLLCLAGFASGQAPPGTYGETTPAFIALIARVDPLDPTRYTEVPADEQTRVVGFFRGRERLPFRVPQVLERDDEFETARDVMAVIRYPIGDVYVDAGTRVRIGSLDVLFGRVFAKVKGFFSIENQNVVAGVEGTEFAFEVARDGSTEITVLDGAVLSSSKRLPWKPLRVTRNQSFWVTNSGMQIKVGATPPTQLAQLQRWVDRADAAVAVLAPREAPTPSPLQPPPPPAAPPEFQPQPPVPPSMQPTAPPLQPVTPPVVILPVPVIRDRSGYCCDAAGGVYPSTPGACRGTLYQYEADAYKQCRVGFCCENNRLFEATAARCSGIFSFDRARVAESCAIKGYCCSDGVLTQGARNQCQGNFYTDSTTAHQVCGPRPGYCCSGGKVLPASPAACPANKYYTSEAAALKACRPVTRGPTTDTGPVGKRTPPDAAKNSPKVPSDAAKTKVESSKVLKNPASGTAKAKASTSQVIKPPPPPSGEPR